METMSKAKNPKMFLEDYLLLIQSRSHLNLTVNHLNQVFRFIFFFNFISQFRFNFISNFVNLIPEFRFLDQIITMHGYKKIHKVHKVYPYPWLTSTENLLDHELYFAEINPLEIDFTFSLYVISVFVFSPPCHFQRSISV